MKKFVYMISLGFALKKFCLNALIYIFCVSSPAPTLASFLVLSEVNGYFCSGFIVERCRHERIDAFATSDGGRLYIFPREIDDVDNFERGRCYVYVNRGIVKKDFFAFQIDGQRRKMIGNPETLVFQCAEK